MLIAFSMEFETPYILRKEPRVDGIAVCNMISFKIFIPHRRTRAPWFSGKGKQVKLDRQGGMQFLCLTSFLEKMHGKLLKPRDEMLI